MTINVEWVTRDVEHLTPEHALEFEVLVSRCEERLPLEIFPAIDFIEDGIVNKLSKDSFILSGLAICLQEEGMALALLNHVVQNDADLVPEAFVVQFVTLFEDHLEYLFERGDNLRVSCKLTHGISSHDLDQVPKRFYCLTDNV